MEKVPHPNQFLGTCNLFVPFALSPFLSHPIHAMLCYAMQEKSRGYAERKKDYAMQIVESHVIHHQ